MLSRRHFLRGLSAAAAAGALDYPFAAVASAANVRRAVLVGVSGYAKDSGAAPLPGAANDVRLMRTLLSRLGFGAGDVISLADEVEAALPPTRANILRILEQQAAGARKGDFYYLHFSGHGSQQPAAAQGTRRSEADGLSEIFLPIDIGRWSGARARVDNALVDDELDALLDRFLERGAFVWAVFDACHSASLMRGAPVEEVVLRQVDPSALGIPQAALQAAAIQAQTATRGQAPVKGALAERGEAKGKGGFVAFYSAQTTEVAPEMAMPLSLPAGDPNKRRHGVLTFMLAEALSTQPQGTYRQLSQFILSRYATQYVSNKPTPMFTGTRLDAPIFGQSVQSPVRQWPLRREAGDLKISVGLLGQVAEGARLAVVPNPLAGDELALGEVEVMRASLFEAQLRPPAARGSQAPLDLAALPDTAYARLVRPAIALRLRVAAPTASATAAEPRRVADAAVALLRSNPPPGVRIDWQTPGAGAELRLHVEDGQVWLLPASGALIKSGSGKTPSIGLARSPTEVANLLADSLNRVGRALNLIRLAEQLPAAAATAGVEVRLEHLPARGAKPRDLDLPRVQVQAGDQIGFTVTNRGAQAVDVTMLYVDSAFGIDALFPQSGENNRVESQGQLKTGPTGLHPIGIDDKTVGTERLIVIVSIAPPQGERADYSYLAQPRLEATRTVRGEDNLLRDFLEDASFGSNSVATRGATRSGRAQATMRVFTWEVRAAARP